MTTTFTDLSLKGKLLSFKISNVDLSIVNSLKRIIQSEIPCVAFYFDTYDVENPHIKINTNTGALHDQFLAHRISLIPLHFDEQEIKEFVATRYKFVLKIKNATSEPVYITTKDFEIYDDKDKKMPESFREHVFPKNPITKDYVLITKLRPNLYDSSKGEEIDIQCMATVGIAEQHARWCAVSQCSFYNAIDTNEAQKAYEDATKNKTASEVKAIKARFETIDKYRHFKKNKYDEPNEFIFYIESECRLTAKQIFKKACEILHTKLIGFSNKVGDLKVQAIGGVPNFFQFEIPQETHTLMNVLQCMTYNKCFRGKEGNPLVSIGYYESHPLEKTMYLKIKLTSSETDIKDFMIAMAKSIADDVNGLLEQWSKL